MTGLRCPSCGFYNLSARTKCARCGKPLPELIEDEKAQGLLEDEQSIATGSGSISISEPDAKTGSGSIPKPEPGVKTGPGPMTKPEPRAAEASGSTITGEVVAETADSLEAVIEEATPEPAPAAPAKGEPGKIKPAAPEIPSFDDSAASKISTEAELGELSQFFKEARKKQQAGPAPAGEPKPPAQEVSRPGPVRIQEPLPEKPTSEEDSHVTMGREPEGVEDSVSQIRIQPGDISHPSNFKPNFGQPVFPDFEAEASAEARSDSDSAVSRPMEPGVFNVVFAGMIDLIIYFVITAAFYLVGTWASRINLDPGAGPGSSGSITPVLIVLLVIVWFYQLFFMAVLGQTPGQIAAGIQTLDKSGSRPGLAKAGLRAFVYLLCLIPLGIGFLPTLLGKSIPDKIADTKVVRW